MDNPSSPGPTSKGVNWHMISSALRLSSSQRACTCPPHFTFWIAGEEKKSFASIHITPGPPTPTLDCNIRVDDGEDALELHIALLRDQSENPHLYKFSSFISIFEYITFIQIG